VSLLTLFHVNSWTTEPFNPFTAQNPLSKYSGNKEQIVLKKKILSAKRVCVICIIRALYICIIYAIYIYEYDTLYMHMTLREIV